MIGLLDNIFVILESHQEQAPVIPDLMGFACLRPGISLYLLRSWAEGMQSPSSGVVAWLNIASTELIVQGLQGRHGEER